MPSYSNRSLSKLQTTHQDLQTIFNYVIRKRDNTIVFGVRTAKEQMDLFKKGRTFDGEKWIVSEGSKIVTYKDGIFEKSRHQLKDGVSWAVDAVPYYPNKPHIRWDYTSGFLRFGSYVLGVADMLYAYGDIEHELEWGGQWGDFKDYAHFQLKIK